MIEGGQPTLTCSSLLLSFGRRELRRAGRVGIDKKEGRTGVEGIDIDRDCFVASLLAMTGGGKGEAHVCHFTNLPQRIIIYRFVHISNNLAGGEAWAFYM